jgi:hypothetical protein
METTKKSITDRKGNPIRNSRALIWGNNAAWLCIDCVELLGNRTGDTEYQVECNNIKCTAKYKIDRAENRNGRLHLGRAKGIRRIR